MFIDEVKVYAKAGHGGKGCIAFLREAYRPKGGPSGGNGGRGGDVILEANHDLNNLIAQFYNPRLVAQDGGHGLGKGMDGKAGKDILVPVPCGTLIWKLPAKTEPLEAVQEVATAEEEADVPPPLIGPDEKAAIRHYGAERAIELDLTEDDSTANSGDFNAREGAELVADLTEHGQRFVLCKAGRGGLGNRNFATARHQTPVLPSRENRVKKAIIFSSFG